MTEPDLTADELYIVKTHIIYSVVCAPVDWDKDKVENEANVKLGNPGTSFGRWVISEGTAVNEAWLETEDGNPGKCTEEHRCHWLLNC